MTNLPKSVAAERAFYEGHPEGEVVSAAVIGRPDLGRDAFELSGPTARGVTAVFPASGGAAEVGVALGFRNQSSTPTEDAEDRHVSQAIVSLVHERLG